jgi:hypothetical protein
MKPTNTSPSVNANVNHSAVRTSGLCSEFDAADRIKPELPKLPATGHLVRVFQILSGIGVFTVLLGLWWDPLRTWGNLLLNSFLMLSMGLAGAVFVALLYVSRAGWGVALRRVPEALARLIPYAGAGLLLVLLCGHSVYPWIDPEDTTGFPPFKQVWLSWPFFLLRAGGIIALWTVLTRRLVGNSLRQDMDGSVSWTIRNVRLSALFLVVFGVTFWLATMDWLMSLEPHWASTVFGPYNFAGLFLGGLALVTLLVFALEQAGPLRGIVSKDHYHDLGKLLFAFSIIWMYLWFCQYMLIWYANIPEETVYYIERLQEAWAPLMWLNILLNWVIPFIVLLPRPMKRSRHILPKICIVVLLGRWLDLYLQIGPALPGFSPLPTPLEAGVLAGAIGLGGWLYLRQLAQAPLVPWKDPYLPESLAQGAQVSLPVVDFNKPGGYT